MIFTLTCDFDMHTRPVSNLHYYHWQISASLASRKQISAIVFQLSCSQIHTHTRKDTQTPLPNVSYMHVFMITVWPS